MATKTKSAPVETVTVERPKWRVIDPMRSIVQSGTTHREVTINLRRDAVPFAKPLNESALADEFEQANENFARLAKLRAKLKETEAKIKSLESIRDEAFADLAADGAVESYDHTLGELQIAREVQTGLHSAIEQTKQKLLGEAKQFVQAKKSELSADASERRKAASAKLLDALNALDELEAFSDASAEWQYLAAVSAGSILEDRINQA